MENMIEIIIFDFENYNDHGLELDEWLETYLLSPDFENLDIEEIRNRVLKRYADLSH